MRALYAELLDRPDATLDDSFVSLRGDSLSYVEASVRLEGLLGTLPESWHVRPVARARPAGQPATPGGTDARSGPSARPHRVATPLALARDLGRPARASPSPSSCSPTPACSTSGVARTSCSPSPASRSPASSSSGGPRSRPGRPRPRVGDPDRAARAPSGSACSSSSTSATRGGTPLLLTSVAGGNVHAQWRYWFVEALVHLLVGRDRAPLRPGARPARAAPRPFAVPMGLARARPRRPLRPRRRRLAPRQRPARRGPVALRPRVGHGPRDGDVAAVAAHGIRARRRPRLLQ